MNREERYARYTAPAAELACRVLRYLAAYAHPKATLSEIAVGLNASKSSCLRVLTVLEREQYVIYDAATRCFGLGSYLYVLGTRAAEQVGFLRAALPHLREAAARTECTCVISQRYGESQLIYVAKEEPASRARISVSVGQRFAITSGSHGKCFLAFMPETQRRAIVARGLRPFTAHSITDAAAYESALAEVRRRGFAVSLEESTLGVNGVAAPIRGSNDEIVATVTAMAISAALPAERIDVVGEHLTRFAEQISRDTRGVSHQAAHLA